MCAAMLALFLVRTATRRGRRSAVAPRQAARRTLVSTAAAGKVLHLVRHGETEMNTYLRANDWAAPDFRDPLLWDTRLTERGQSQASALARTTSTITPPPELIAVSPLTRALHTADLAFGQTYRNNGTAWVACPLARERNYHASDIGRPAEELADEDFAAHVDFAEATGNWWGGPREMVQPLEPDAQFTARMLELTRWLARRDEQSIALVCHWGVLYALTGRQFSNCELATVRLGSLTTWASLEIEC